MSKDNPTKKCSTCSKTISITHRFIHCQTCSKTFHIKCNNTHLKEYQQIKKGTLPEICRECTNINPETNHSHDMPFSHISDTQFKTIVQDFQDLSASKPSIPKPKCAICSKTIAKNHRNILCEICNCQVHIKCNLTDVTSYNKIIRDKLPQKCKTCDPSQINIKPKCCVCNRKIADNHKKLECNTCQSFIHIKCNKTDPKHYDKIMKDTGSPKIDHCNNCLIDNIPFQNLSELEFTAICKGIDTEADVLNDTFITSGNLELFFNLINKTNNPFEIDTTSLDAESDDTVLINCKYYDLSTFNFKKVEKKFSLFHTNIGSLEKH